MPNSTRPPQTRPPQRREKHEARLNLNLKPSFKKQLDRFSEQHDLERSDIMRDGAEAYMLGYLPVPGKIPCGPLSEAVADTPYYEVVPQKLKPRADLGDFILQATGDSMAPEIRPGDLVIFRPNIEWYAGQTCAVQVFHDKHSLECMATLKRVFHGSSPDEVILRACNPMYKDQRLPAELVRVVGVFIGLIREHAGQQG